MSKEYGDRHFVLTPQRVICHFYALLRADGDTDLELEKAFSANGSAGFHQNAASLQKVFDGDAVIESLKIANKLLYNNNYCCISHSMLKTHSKMSSPNLLRLAQIAGTLLY